MSASLAVNHTLDDTLGAALLGIVGATFLFGVTTLQVYLYYQHYHRDSRLHKIAVAVLWILDMFHLVLIIHAVYHYAVKGFGDTSNLAHVVWSIKLQAVINVIIVLFVQSLYAYRVWILGGYHHGVMGYVVATVVVFGFGIGTVLAYKIYTVQMFLELQSISWAIDSSLATSTAIDFIISSAMCFYLHKSRVAESRLNLRISTIMQYCLSSGLFTSACSLSTLFTYTLMPNNLIFMGLQFLSTKFYVGSFLAMLNARQRRPATTDQQSSKHGIEFRVQTLTSTDSPEPDTRWQHQPSPTSSTPPLSPSDDPETESTYVSFDQSSKKSWDVDVESHYVEPPPVAMVYSLNTPRRAGHFDYMS